MTLRTCSESGLAKASSGQLPTGIRQPRIRNEIRVLLGIIDKGVLCISVVCTITITHSDWRPIRSISFNHLKTEFPLRNI
jgi:hypothetical protein